MRYTSRKTGIFLILIAACLMLLTACGNSRTPTDSSPPGLGTSEELQQEQGTEQQPGNEQEQAAAPTKIVTDDLNREVEVPTAPQRIVAGEFAAELLQLGIKPVGSGENGFKVIYTQSDMEGVERIGDPPNSEKVVELAPDLVIAPTVFQEIYPEQMEQISKIAPVFYLSFEQDPIYGIFVKLAELVGETDKAQAWIAAYEQEAESARQLVNAAIGEETASIFRIEKGRFRIYLNRNFAGYMLRSSLQVAAPTAVSAEIEKNPNSSAVQISLELLPEYAGDHLFVIVRSEGDDREAFKEIEETALWQGLDAVKNGKVHFLETDKYYGSDIVTILETMKETAATLVSASSGTGN